MNSIPWAGPFVCLAACRHPGPYSTALIVDGSFQLLTTVLWIIGAAVQVGGGRDSALLELDGVRFEPWASAQGSGLSVLKACNVFVHDVNLKPYWLPNPWGYHWSDYKCDLSSRPMLNAPSRAGRAAGRRGRSAGRRPTPPRSTPW